MNLRDLKYIIAVAETRHFGKAAERCFVSQPTLSGQIKKLEEELEVTLFERTNRSVEITPVGNAILSHARLIQEQADLSGLRGQFVAHPHGEVMLSHGFSIDMQHGCSATIACQGLNNGVPVCSAKRRGLHQMACGLR